MSQSCCFGDKIGHAESVGLRSESAIGRSESRITSSTQGVFLLVTVTFCGIFVCGPLNFSLLLRDISRSLRVLLFVI